MTPRFSSLPAALLLYIRTFLTIKECILLLKPCRIWHGILTQPNLPDSRLAFRFASRLKTRELSNSIVPVGTSSILTCEEERMCIRNLLTGRRTRCPSSWFPCWNVLPSQDWLVLINESEIQDKPFQIEWYKVGEGDKLKRVKMICCNFFESMGTFWTENADGRLLYLDEHHVLTILLPSGILQSTKNVDLGAFSRGPQYSCNHTNWFEKLDWVVHHPVHSHLVALPVKRETEKEKGWFYVFANLHTRQVTRCLCQVQMAEFDTHSLSIGEKVTAVAGRHALWIVPTSRILDTECATRDLNGTILTVPQGQKIEEVASVGNHIAVQYLYRDEVHVWETVYV